MKYLLIILSLLFFTGCSRTRKIGLSNKEVKSLKVVYSQEYRDKFWDERWVFYEKCICQFSTKFIARRTITGTWSEQNDTITANFFLSNRYADTRQVYIDKENGKLVRIIK